MMNSLNTRANTTNKQQNKSKHSFGLPLSAYVIIVTLLAVLTLVNFDIYQKEQHLLKGKVIRLGLAPVDPRSLMQGDYMVLNYAIAAQVSAFVPEGTTDGTMQVKLDENQVASLISVDEIPLTTYSNIVAEAQALTTMSIQYRIRNHQVKFASNGYFFEEGQGERYEQAEYGQFRVNEQGSLLLESLLDNSFNVL